jgi:hypothetical protein
MHPHLLTEVCTLWQLPALLTMIIVRPPIVPANPAGTTVLNPPTLPLRSGSLSEPGPACAGKNRLTYGSGTPQAASVLIGIGGHQVHLMHVTCRMCASPLAKQTCGLGATSPAMWQAAVPGACTLCPAPHPSLLCASRTHPPLMHLSYPVLLHAQLQR